jgi:molybdenum cofactor cytidylyltransferase
MTATAKRSNAMHGCIIMASGIGRRFGSNKLLAELDGMPLVQHVLLATDGLFERRVVVTRHAEVAKLCQAGGVRVIEHDEPHRNDTVRLGMQAMEGCDAVTFFQGDQPLISGETIARLLRAAEDDPKSIWRASFQGTPGAPVLFPTWTFPELCSLPDCKGGGFVAKAHGDRVRLVEAASAWELRDVDTVEDLHELAEHIKRAGCE